MTVYENNCPAFITRIAKLFLQPGMIVLYMLMVLAGYLLSKLGLSQNDWVSLAGLSTILFFLFVIAVVLFIIGLRGIVRQVTKLEILNNELHIQMMNKNTLKKYSIVREFLDVEITSEKVRNIQYYDLAVRDRKSGFQFQMHEDKKVIAKLLQSLSELNMISLRPKDVEMVNDVVFEDKRGSLFRRAAFAGFWFVALFLLFITIDSPIKSYILRVTGNEKDVVTDKSELIIPESGAGNPWNALEGDFAIQVQQGESSENTEWKPNALEGARWGGETILFFNSGREVFGSAIGFDLETHLLNGKYEVVTDQDGRIISIQGETAVFIEGQGETERKTIGDRLELRMEDNKLVCSGFLLLNGEVHRVSLRHLSSDEVTQAGGFYARNETLLRGTNAR